VQVPTLRTARLVLEPLGEHHSDGMFALWSNPDVCRYSGPITGEHGESIGSPARSKAETDSLLRFWLNARDAGWGFRWALLSRESGDFAGAAGFNSLGAVSEYAYHLLPDYWRRGLMSEASVAAFDWLSSLGSCSQIEAVIDRENQRSVSFAERHGFVASPELVEGMARYVRPC
jgi:ribosomal-protein-alanine N-acetyltransferase